MMATTYPGRFVADVERWDLPSAYDAIATRMALGWDSVQTCRVSCELFDHSHSLIFIFFTRFWRFFLNHTVDSMVRRKENNIRTWEALGLSPPGTFRKCVLF